MNKPSYQPNFVSRQTNGKPPYEAKPTPYPGFDLAEFARESERKLRAADIRPAPPPEAQERSEEKLRAAGITGGDTTPLEIRACLDECEERVQLLHQELHAGRMSHREAAQVLRTELASISDRARDARCDSLASLSTALREMIEELGDIANEHPTTRLDVAILDDSTVTRSRVALSVESLGHVARGAVSFAELALIAYDWTPKVVLVSSALAELAGSNLRSRVCGAIGLDDVVLVVFSNEPTVKLGELKQKSGATHVFKASSEGAGFVDQIRPIFEELGW